MKKIILLFICFLVCISCQSQEKTDLEKIDFSNNYKEIFKNVKFQTESREITTTLPIAYTKDVDMYEFGKIAFKNSPESFMKSSTIGILIDNITDRQTKGVKIEIEDTSIGYNLFTYLKSQYGSPKILSELPKKNREGKILGNSAYSWNIKDKTIVFVQFYEYTDNKPNVSSILYIVDNKIMCVGLQETVSSHILRTFTQ